MTGVTSWCLATRARRGVAMVALCWLQALVVLWTLAPVASMRWISVGGLLALPAGYAVLAVALRHPRSRQPSWLPLVGLGLIPVAFAALWMY